VYTVPTVADFHARFDAGEPDFANGTVTDVTIQYWLDDSAKYLSADRWDTWYAEGLMCLAAHVTVLQVWQAKKGGGAALAHEYESKSVGGVSASRSQGVTREAADRFQRTTYGQRYVQLRKVVGTGALVTGGFYGVIP